jgi:Cu/Ag efflux protein CusF
VRPSLPGRQSLHGIVDSVDQGNDTIEVHLSPDKTERFRVQDGLVFNAVRCGDQVEITVQNITGAMTIVGLKKE